MVQLGLLETCCKDDVHFSEPEGGSALLAAKCRFARFSRR